MIISASLDSNTGNYTVRVVNKRAHFSPPSTALVQYLASSRKRPVGFTPMKTWEGVEEAEEEEAEDAESDDSLEIIREEEFDEME